MHFRIDSKIFEQNPNLKIGAIVIRGFDNSRRVSAVESLLRGMCVAKQKEFANKDLEDETRINAWFQTFGRFGVNPKKYPPSIAALVKRLKSGGDLPHVNVLVDLYNYFSLKFNLPIGGEDLDWLCGDLELKFTDGDEPFRALGSIEVKHAKEGEAAYLDQGGITCRYWNHRECERSKFTSKTTNAVLFLEDTSGIHMDKFGEMLKEMQSAIIKYVGGQIEPYILTEENAEIDLGVQGRTQADDSKVPQQEIAHYMERHPNFIPSPEEQKKKSPAKPNKPKPAVSKLALKDPDSYREKLAKLLAKAVEGAFPELKNPSINIEYPSSSDHGDYAANIAMQLSKELGKNPREIAEAVVAKMPKNNLISKTDIAGPGFINFFLSEENLNEEIEAIIKEEDQYGASSVGAQKNIIVEYSQPNIAKPLGVHHLLSTIIGQSLYNVLNKIGFKAVSINHIGDWGTQFGKLIYAYKQWGDKSVVEADPIPELLKLYVKFHDEAEKDSKIEDNGREEFRKFEEGDKENHELWEWFVAESMKDVQKTYDKLGGIHFDHTQGESFYSDKMADILEDGRKKGIIVDGEQGAWVVNFEDENTPTVPIRKKDGATLYITRDFATIRYRIQTWDPVKILYVVDVAQSLHFKQVFEAARMLGIAGDQGEHVVFGRMQMKDARMSTRKGNIVLLDEVLDEAKERAGKLIAEKSPDLENQDEVARVVGIGAIKYNILSQNRTTNITFDWDKILTLDGNSAPYLQYTYARARSILRKADSAEVSDESENKTVIESRTSDLVRFFPKFREQVLNAALEYKPNIISNYLFELAQKFNTFYNSVPVLRAPSQEELERRLKIVHAASQILKNGLALLGVEVVEEM
jgi:arginyl-tRNA synthetase